MWWQVADDELAQKAPPWESRATHNQLQGKEEEKTQSD